tara:strand:- start:194 stop:1228 length:1035 start_codon:yes stop_codon:yes gene_type:complete
MNNKNKTQKIAVIGTGYFSQFHFDAWKRLNVKLVGVCSLDLNKAKSEASAFKDCKYFSDYEEMIKVTKPSLIDIIIPPKDHLEVITNISKYGINIICQKPLTNSLKDAKKVLNLIRKTKIKLIVHENFRFQPWHIQIKKMLKKKLIGKPYQITFKMRPGDGQGRYAYLNRQPYFQKMQRFLIHETGIHFIDLFRYFFGDFKSVAAFLFKLNKHIKGEDNGIILFEFKNGIKGLFDANRLSDHVADDRRLTIGDLFVEGEKGTIRLDGNGNIFLRKFLSNKEKKINYIWFKNGFAGDSVFYFQKYLIKQLKTNERIVNEIEEYITNIEIEEAIYRSNKMRKTIFL